MGSEKLKLIALYDDFRKLLKKAHRIPLDRIGVAVGRPAVFVDGELGFDHKKRRF